MSILTEFIGAYNPVQAVKMPLNAYLYKSDAISGLAQIASEQLAALSAELSGDYATHAELSAHIATNELSAGVLSIDNAVLSVEHIGDYDVVNFNGSRVYNLGGKQIVQSAIPRCDLDASITVLKDPVTGQYFRLVAVIDDNSMEDPDAEVNISIEVIQTTKKATDEAYERIYIRVPGENERYSVNYLYVGLAPDGTPQLEASSVAEDLAFKLGQVVDSIFFMGDTIRSVNRDAYTPECIIASYEHGGVNLWLRTDSEYSQHVVEDEMRVFNKNTNERIDGLVDSLSSIENDISAFKDDVAAEISAVNGEISAFRDEMTSAFNEVNLKFNAVRDVISAVNEKADLVNERVDELSSLFIEETRQINDALSGIRSDIGDIVKVILAYTQRMAGIDTLLSDCTIEDQRGTVNSILSVFQTPVSDE